MDAGILSFGFFQNAILAAVLASIACGIIGSLVVVKRMVTVSGGISHAAFGGVGLGYLFSIDPIVGAFFFSVGVALCIGIVKEKAGQEIDTLIGAVWAAGMAVGIITSAPSIRATPMAPCRTGCRAARSRRPRSPMSTRSSARRCAAFPGARR